MANRIEMVSSILRIQMIPVHRYAVHGHGAFGEMIAPFVFRLSAGGKGFNLMSGFAQRVCDFPQGRLRPAHERLSISKSNQRDLEQSPMLRPVPAGIDRAARRKQPATLAYEVICT